MDINPEKRSQMLQRVIRCDGYMAFRGKMCVIVNNAHFRYTHIEGDWLYKPDTLCWYCKGSSWPESLCEIVEVE